MTQIHFGFRRINPALTIDLCSIGTLADGAFKPLSADDEVRLRDALSRAGFPDFLHRDSISSECYVHHEDVSSFVSSLAGTLDWFQDTLVFASEFNLVCNEPSKKEKE